MGAATGDYDKDSGSVEQLSPRPSTPTPYSRLLVTLGPDQTMEASGLISQLATTTGRGANPVAWG